MALMLLNRQAGGGRAAALEPVLRSALACERLAPADPSNASVLATPDTVAEAEALIHAQAPGSRVVLVGGDGSVHTLLPALLARRCGLGLVPAGSGDDIARALGVHGLPVHTALHLALTGATRSWDVGEVQTVHGQRLFLSSLCIGFDAAVAARAAGLPAWLPGRHRYTAATLLQLLRLRLHRLQLQLDGEPVDAGGGQALACLMAPVLNTPSYGGGLPAVPDALPDDGQLNLLLAGRFSRLGALQMLPVLMRGQHLPHPQLQARGFRHLHLHAQTALPLAADGEALPASTDVQVRVRPAALQVVGRPQGRQGSAAEPPWPA